MKLKTSIAAIENGKYLVPNKDGSAVRRPNKLAAGMQATIFRNNDAAQRKLHVFVPDEARSRRIVYGTTDILASGFMFKVRFAKCACCGARSNKIVLNDAGKARLLRLRRAFSRRLAESINAGRAGYSGDPVL